MRIAFLLAVLIASAAAGAQQPSGSDWKRVQQTAPGTLLRIASGHRPSICSFVSADEDSLTCNRTHYFVFIPITQRLNLPRQSITTIKLSRHSLSTLTGGAIGLGAGAGIGAAVDASAKSQEDGHLVTALGAILGFVVGSGVGSSLDFLASPTLYRAP